MSKGYALDKLYDEYGSIKGKKVIELVDQLDDIPYGPRYLANPVKEPTFDDLTPLTRKRLLKEL